MSPDNKMTETERRSGRDSIKKRYHTLGVLNSLLRISLQDVPLEKQLELSLDELLSLPFLPVLPKGAIFLVEEKPDVLVLKAHRNMSDPLIRMCANVPFGKCLCGLAAESGGIEFADRIDERHHIHYEGMQEHGHYNIPILSKNRVLGVIVLYLSKDHIRKQEETDFLHAVADTLAGIIEHKRVEQKLKKTADSLAEAQRIARFGNWEWDMIRDELYWSDEIYTIFGINRGQTLPSYESFLDAVHPEDRDKVKKAVDLALRKKKPYNIDHRIMLPDSTEKIVHEQAVVRFDDSGKPVRMSGTVQDITRRKQTENQLLKINDLMNALNETQSQFITDAPPKDLFAKMLDALISLTNSEFGFIGEILYSEAGEPYLKTYALTNISWDDTTRKFYKEKAPDGMEFRNLKTLFGAVISTAEPVISNDPENDSRKGGLPEGHPPLNSFMGVPLHKGAKFVGMFGVANRPGGYDKSIIKFLQPLTSNCANIIEAYRSDEQRQKAEKALWEHSEEVTALAESSNVIGAIPLTENLYEAICNVAVRQFKLAMVWIGLVEGGTPDIKPLAYAGDENGYLDDHTVRSDDSPEGMGPAGTAVKTKAPQVTAEISRSGAYAPWREKALARGYRSAMAVPLINSDSNIIAVLNFYSNEDRYFTRKRQHLLHVYTNYVTVALENRRLIEGLEQKVMDRTSELEEYGYKLRRLYNFSFASGQNAKEFTNTVLIELAELLDVDAAALGTIDNSTWTAYAAADRNGLGLREGMVCPFDEVFCNIVETTRKPLMISNAGESDEYRTHPNYAKHGITSYLGVPVFIDDKPFGILCTMSRTPHEYKDYDLTLHQLLSLRLEFEFIRERYINDLRSAMLQAKSANKAKSDFLANMSHELRTPLNSIIGFSEMIYDGMTGEINEKQKEFLADVIESSKHLLSLINDILDLSKIEAGKMELELNTINVSSLLKDSMEMFKHKTTAHNINTEVTVEAGLQSITGDERKIKQVIYNLLGNAMKFTPDRGSISIHARTTTEQTVPSASRRDKDSYKGVEISVKDTGKGIPPEHLNMLFKPFEQLENPYLKKNEGTGLGLALCKQIVELHGGRLYVESRVGAGSTFSFVIPVRQGDDPGTDADKGV